MQIGSNPAAMAMRQIAQSTQMLNELNQKIVDETQSMAGKLIKVAAEDKIAVGQAQQKLNLLA